MTTSQPSTQFKIVHAALIASVAVRRIPRYDSMQHQTISIPLNHFERLSVGL